MNVKRKNNFSCSCKEPLKLLNCSLLFSTGSLFVVPMKVGMNKFEYINLLSVPEKIYIKLIEREQKSFNVFTCT